MSRDPRKYQRATRDGGRGSRRREKRGETRMCVVNNVCARGGRRMRVAGRVAVDARHASRGDGTRGTASGERNSSHDLRDGTTFTVSVTHRIARGKRIG